MQFAGLWLFADLIDTPHRELTSGNIKQLDTRLYGTSTGQHCCCQRDTIFEQLWHYRNFIHYIGIVILV